MLLTMIKMMLSYSHMRMMSVNTKGKRKAIGDRSVDDGVKESRQINWSIIDYGVDARLKGGRFSLVMESVR
jgi:hypothetical protein